MPTSARGGSRSPRPLDLPARLPIVPYTASPVVFGQNAFGTGTGLITVGVRIGVADLAYPVSGTLAAPTAAAGSGIVISVVSGETRFTGTEQAVSRYLSQSGNLNYTGPAGMPLTVKRVDAAGVLRQAVVSVTADGAQPLRTSPALTLPTQWTVGTAGRNSIVFDDAVFDACR